MLLYKEKLILFFCIVALSIGVENSFAQIPSSVDPTRQAFQEDASSQYNLKKQKKLQSHVPEISDEKLLLRFQLNSLEVKGASAFSHDQFATFYQNHLGQDISLADLFQIVTEIQQLYLDKGFSLSKVSIPEQHIQDGNITFEVIEGYVSSVEIDDELRNIDMIDNFVAAVLAMKPLNVKKLERMLLIMNDRPSVKVTSVLSDLDNFKESGAIKLILQDARNKDDLNPVSGSVMFNNYGSVFSGPGRIEGSINLKNAGINLSDIKLEARTTTSLPESQQLSFEYTQPVFGILGTTIGVNASVSFINPGSSLDKLDVMGRSRTINFSIDYPLIRQRDENLVLGTSFTYTNSETDLLQTEITNDKLRVLKAKLAYSKADRWRGLNFMNLSISKGLNILNASKEKDTNLSRQDGEPQFHKLMVSYTRFQSLPKNLSLSFSMSGQHTPNPLLSSEEFGFGGINFGRGYDASEITGDRGISANIELRYDKALSQYDLNLQPFIFYDIGKVWNIDPGAKDKTSAASAGIGFRLRHDNGWSLDTTLAKPLTLNTSSPPKYTNKDGVRFLLQLKNEF